MNITYIGADWCKYCVKIEPAVEKIAEKHQIKTIKIVKENKEGIKAGYGITCIPALFIYDDEKNLVDNWHADMDEKFEEFCKRNNL